MTKLEGKTVLVTGGSRGIGRAIAERLAEQGARVALTYVNNKDAAESVLQTIEEAGGSALTLQADVSDLDSIAQLFRALREHFDGLDVLVNNAGRGSGGFPELLDVTPAQYDAVFDLNARGLFFVTQHAVRMMRDGGRIVSISSMASRIRMAGLSTYTASKAAADAFTRSLAMELAPRGITINSVNCGIVETEMVAGIQGEAREHLLSLIPMGRIGQTRDIADVVAFLASDASRWITGEEISASGGQYV
jgi:3-oxoacyl-[acyl-carrier protein] reductase